MAITKYLNPNYTPEGSEPKYISIDSNEYVTKDSATTDIVFSTIPSYTPGAGDSGNISAGDTLQTVIAKLAYKLATLELDYANFKAAVQPDDYDIVYVSKTE